MLLRGLLAALFVSCSVMAQESAAAPQESTLQALLKEVHALRLVMERSNQIAPRIQIALAKMQLQEERVRNAVRQIQDAHDKIADVQMKRAENADRVKQTEAQQAQTVDPNVRKQMDFEIAQTKAEMDRLSTLEQQFRAKEAEVNAILLTEQAKWNEANDLLNSIERVLAQPPQQ